MVSTVVKCPSLISDIEATLRDLVHGLVPTVDAAGPGRPRIIPDLCLWMGLIVCVLRGFNSQLAVWRLLSSKGLWFYPRFPVSDQAVYKRLAQATIEPLQNIFAKLTLLLAERIESFVDDTLAPFARDVIVLDATTLDQAGRLLPTLRGLADNDDRLLPGRLAGIFDIRRQLWRWIKYIESPRENEKVSAPDLVEELAPGTLLLADLGYFGFPWFDELTDKGLWWVSRLRNKTSYEVIHTYYDQDGTFDGVIFLGAYRADRAAHAVRLVRYQTGDKTCSYITNVLQPKILPISEIARLYARRWDIELAIKLVKRQLGLHLIWSAKPIIVQQQIWAVLIIAQILQTIRTEIAGRADVDPFDVSMDLLVQYLPEFSRMGQDPIKAFVEQGRQLRFIRSSTRTKIKAPDIAQDEIVPLPTDLLLNRKARCSRRNYASRKRNKLE